jgi:hypothetical protein
MADLKITFDQGDKLDITEAINAAVLPLLAQAVKAVAKQTAITWQEEVFRAKLWTGEKDAYAKSITWSSTGDFTAVVEATYDQAQEIEDGRPPRDLKKMLNTSSKVRRTKSGKRFLIIPMRQNAPGANAKPGAMPSDIYALAKAMTPSKVIGQSKRRTGEVTHLSPKFGMMPAKRQTPFVTDLKRRNPYTGNGMNMMVKKNNYEWGGHLTHDVLKQAGLSAGDVKKYSGLVKMQAKTPGGKNYSAYMTFRVMMEGSPGWWVPAQPGLKIAQKVVEKMQPKAQAAFTKAVEMMVQRTEPIIR